MTAENQIRAALRTALRLPGFLWHRMLIEHGPEEAERALKVVAVERNVSVGALLPADGAPLE